MSVVNWHYRIVRHHDGSLSLCEVYYSEGGVIVEIITNPLFSALPAGGQSAVTIIEALGNALRDAKSKPILDVMAKTETPRA